MNRVFHALLVVLCFEMGALLLYLPWSVYWDQNYFLSHFPTLILFFCILRFAAPSAASAFWIFSWPLT